MFQDEATYVINDDDKLRVRAIFATYIIKTLISKILIETFDTSQNS